MGRQESQSKNSSKSHKPKIRIADKQKGLGKLVIKTKGVVYYLSMNWRTKNSAQNKDQRSDGFRMYRLRYIYKLGKGIKQARQVTG